MVAAAAPESRAPTCEPSGGSWLPVRLPSTAAATFPFRVLLVALLLGALGATAASILPAGLLSPKPSVPLHLPVRVHEPPAARRALFGFAVNSAVDSPLDAATRQESAVARASSGVATCPASELTGGVQLCVDRVDERTRDEAREEDLYQSWTRLFALGEGQHEPPKLPQGNIVQLTVAPPHLAECEKSAKLRHLAERRPADGRPPAWAREKRTEGLSPPWVRGAEPDSLALTREAQAAIWLHQFPHDCSDPSMRFLVAEWSPPGAQGLAARVHAMAASLVLALQHGRVLVYLPGSFQDADLPGCTAANESRSFQCFFAPVTSARCQDEALSQLALRSAAMGASIAGRDGVVLLRLGHTLAPAADKWDWMLENVGQNEGEEEAERTAARELMASELKQAAEAPYKVDWLQAQAVRFMLRWPSAYLCHLANHARHRAYGRAVARQMAAAEKAQSLVVELRDELKAAAEKSEQAGLQPLTAPLRGLEWRGGREEVWGELYVPRPIASVHVSKGAAAALPFEALAAHMWAAESLRRHSPDLRQVWLSSDEENVIDQSKCFHSWSFQSAYLPADATTRATPLLEGSPEAAVPVAVALVNVLMAQQCDFFVGTPSADWASLINELRATSGRLRARDKAVENSSSSPTN